MTTKTTKAKQNSDIDAAIEDIAWGEYKNAEELLVKNGASSKEMKPLVEAYANGQAEEFEEAEEMFLKGQFAALGLTKYYATWLEMGNNSKIHFYTPHKDPNTPQIIGKRGCTQDYVYHQAWATDFVPADAWQNPEKYGYQICKKCFANQAIFPGPQLHIDHEWDLFDQPAMAEAFREAMRQVLSAGIEADPGNHEVLLASWHEGVAQFAAAMMEQMGDEPWKTGVPREFAQQSQNLIVKHGSPFQFSKLLPAGWALEAARYAGEKVHETNLGHNRYLRQHDGKLLVQPGYVGQLRNEILAQSLNDEVQKAHGYTAQQPRCPVTRRLKP